jgi:hypothetical protein
MYGHKSANSDDGHMNDEPWLQVLPASGLFDAELRQRAEAEFGPDGAWLLLSQLAYGWRAYYDLAVAVVTGAPPENATLTQHNPTTAFRQVVDLQVQSLLFAVGEQFAATIVAARAHQRGTDNYLREYVKNRPIKALVDALADLTHEELAALVRLPNTSDEILALASAVQPQKTPELDPRLMPVTDVGGLVVPTSVIERGAAERSLTRTRELVDLLMRNVRELGQLVASPDVEGESPRPQPLRAIDNSFRHGFRVLLRDALPSERRFRAIDEPVEPLSEHSVEVYLPGDDAVRFGTIDCRPERTAQHLVALKELSQRLGQFLRGFIGAQVFEHGGLIVSATQLELPEPPAVLGA